MTDSATSTYSRFPSLPDISTAVVLALGFALVLLAAYYYASRPSGNAESAQPAQKRDFNFIILDILHRTPGILLVSGLLFIFLGVGFKEHGYALFVPDPAYLSSFLKELGFATIIAYFISVGIEKIARDNHNKHVAEQLDMIKRDVFAAIYKIDHDPNYISFVDQHVYKHKIYREKYKVTMQLRPMERNVERYHSDTPLICEVNLGCRIHNKSREDMKYEHLSFIEMPLKKEHNDYVKMTSVTVNGRPRTDLQHGADDNAKDTPQFKRFAFFIDLPAGGYVDVSLDFQFVKFARDEMVWRVVDPADSFHLVMFHPQELSPGADAMHCAKDGNVPIQNSETAMELLINEPLFRQNGVDVWWAPKDFDESRSASNGGTDGGDKSPE